MTLRLHPTTRGLVVEHDGRRFPLPGVGWDAIFARDDLADWLLGQIGSPEPAPDGWWEAAPRFASVVTSN